MKVVKTGTQVSLIITKVKLMRMLLATVVRLNTRGGGGPYLSTALLSKASVPRGQMWFKNKRESFRNNSLV